MENLENFDETQFDFKIDAGIVHSKPVILDAVFNQGKVIKGLGFNQIE